MKRSRILMGIALVALMVAPRLMAMSSRKPPVTLLVAPARYTVLQVANDIVAKRPAVLVAYQESDDGMRLQVWNKESWIPVTMRDYEQSTFMRIKPTRIVLIAPGGSREARILEAASVWCPQVEKIEVLQTTALLNRLGRIFNFSPAEWNWFAARYNCELEIENEEELNRSWYDQDGSQFRQKEEMGKERELLLPAEERRMDIETLEGDGAVMEDEVEEENASTSEEDSETTDEKDSDVKVDAEEKKPKMDVDEDSGDDDED